MEGRGWFSFMADIGLRKVDGVGVSFGGLEKGRVMVGFCFKGVLGYIVYLLDNMI